jgi:hypothetical protein
MALTTHDMQMQKYREEYVPDFDPNHWSESAEWLALQKARAAATQRLFPACSVHSGDVNIENTPEVREAQARFEEKFPPEDEPVHVPSTTPRQAELQSAQIELRRAVQRMKQLAHPDRIVGLVQCMVSE